MFDDVGILKTDGTIASVTNVLSETLIIGKTNILDNNFFQLLKFRDQLTLDSFNFIKNEYLLHVEASVILYTWLFENIGIETNCVTDSQKRWFEFQKNAVTQHAEKLRAKFSLAEILKRTDYSKMDIKVPNFFKNKRYGELMNETLEENSKKKAATKTKLYKITNEEADKFLLETVFNVHLLKTDN